MLFTDRMKSTVEGLFYISNNSGYPLNFRYFDALRTTTGGYGNILMAAFLKSIEAFKAIGYHISIGSLMLLSPAFDRFLEKCTHLAEPNGECMIFVTYGYRCDERNFPGTTSSSSFAITFFASPISVVDLDHQHREVCYHHGFSYPIKAKNEHLMNFKDIQLSNRTD
jgi:hypothetical protein